MNIQGEKDTIEQNFQRQLTSLKEEITKKNMFVANLKHEKKELQQSIQVHLRQIAVRDSKLEELNRTIEEKVMALIHHGVHEITQKEEFKKKREEGQGLQK